MQIVKSEVTWTPCAAPSPPARLLCRVYRNSSELYETPQQSQQLVDALVAVGERALAADVAGLCDALAIDKVHYCGVSLGGQVAQTFALNYPERLASLTLVNSTCEYNEAQTLMWREHYSGTCTLSKRKPQRSQKIVHLLVKWSIATSQH